jgi:hypothetical protein
MFRLCYCKLKGATEISGALRGDQSKTYAILLKMLVNIFSKKAGGLIKLSTKFQSLLLFQSTDFTSILTTYISVHT